MLEGLREYAKTEAEVATLEAVIATNGNRAQAARNLGKADSTVKEAIIKIKNRAAAQGYSPDHDMTKTVPDGFVIKGTSTLYDQYHSVSGGKMNRQEKEIIKQIVLDYLEYQRKSDDKEGFLCMGDGGGLEPSSRGSGKRPDPIAVKIDRANRNEEEITQNERVARELLWLLTPCERVCVTAWESIKNAINKATKDRYRKSDVIYYLRSNGMPVDQDRYEFFKECGEAGLLIAHKKRFPDQWKVVNKKKRLKFCLR